MSFKANKRLYRVISVLLALTVITTNMTAVSIARTGPGSDASAACAIPAHTHTEPACYEETKELICAETEGNIHVHTDELKCFAYQTVPVCGQEESETHTHDDSCMAQEQITVCLLTEGEPHFHDDAICYAYGQELVCLQDEHIHGESCAAEEPAEEEQTEQPAEPEETAGPLPVVWQSVSDAENQVSVTGMLPEGVEVLARALEQEELEALGVDPQTTVFAYDITLWLDGVEYQPEQPVEVTVLASANGDETVNVQHIDVDESTGATMVEPVTDSTTAEGTVTFTAEGFSVYVGTVNEEEQSVYEQLLAAEHIEDLYDLLYENGYIYDLETMTEDELTALTAHAEAIYDETNDDPELYEMVMDGIGTYTGAYENDAEPLDILSGYICFDLSQENVTITQDTYSGKLNGEVVTGTHLDTNKYYIFQGDGTSSYTSVPTYEGVTHDGMSWGNYITNHPSRSSAGDDSVDEVITAWKQATSGKRTATANRVTFQTTKSNTTFNVTIDNLWSTGSTGKDTGLSFQSIGTTLRTNSADDRRLNDTYTDCAIGVTVNLTVKGDNRFNRLHCATQDGQNGSYNSDINHTNIINISGDSTATLTLANNDVNSSAAYTSALIGGTDRIDHSFKMSFNDITVYAGGGRLDFGTAIGGGGNGDGRVTITGGRITAVNSATGTAIGGGCGTTGPGGYGNVTITGGEVYAYNYTPHYTSEGSTAYTDAMPTAIGGGSSGTREGGTGIVKISGGRVYAYSEVGNAIGGGGGGDGDSSSNVNTYGGTADIIISESAYVEAISGTGCAIGGGPGGGNDYKNGIPSNRSADGGTAKLTITGTPTIISGSIGGGSPLEKNRIYGATVGAAVVNISGGTIHGQVVMDGVIKNAPAEIALTNGAASSFTMTGGLIDNTFIDEKYHFVEENGGAVYINSGSATISGGTIQNASADNGGAVYLEGGTFTMTGGTITNVSVKDTTVGNGGAVCVNGGEVTISGGTISNYKANLGGAIYVTGGSVNMSGGMLNGGNGTANAASGGAAYVSGGNFTMTGGAVVSNTVSRNGGAVLVEGGQVIIGLKDCQAGHKHPQLSSNKAVNGGAISVEGENVTPIVYCGEITGNKATANGGAIYLNATGTSSLTVKNGTFSSNEAVNGGAAYIQGGSFILEDGTMQNNTATNGGGVYLTGGTPDLKNGTLQGNIATNNGGGIYIDKQNVLLNPTVTVTITGNRASGNGAGIYIGGTDGTDASFSLADGAVGTVVLSGNGSAETGNGSAETDNGGAVCIENGWFEMDSEKITVTNNMAVNGGGVAVLSGNFSMSAGTIGGTTEEGNKAENGGGVYVSGGTATVSGTGAVTGNAATANGGGINVANGTFLMQAGTVISNSAMANGGGVHVSGGTFRMEGGAIGGSAETANTAVNGGGVSVADGNVEIIDGSIDYNTASGSGGGMYVAAATKGVQVDMLSGSLSHNTAAVNGGGMAVEGTTQTATINIGCLQDHSTIPFQYENRGDPHEYATLAGADKKHASCPQVVSNTCANIGGGFYMNSGSSTLNFYCVYEEGNKAAAGQENCWGMDVEGGTVNIGDSIYHNREVDAKKEVDQKQGKAYGNVQIKSEILINGGTVNVYGDMDNPQFENRITVDIKTTGGSFTDHRRAKDETEKQYKVQYMENFIDPATGKVTGKYISRQYTGSEAEKVPVEGGIFEHEGYEILGWYAYKADGTTKVNYSVGDELNLTIMNEDQGMGTQTCTCDDCNKAVEGDADKDNYLLVLYANWKLKGYQIHFDPGVETGETVEGVGDMPNISCNYGTEYTLPANKFKRAGYRFVNWKVQNKNVYYEDEAKVKNLTEEDGIVVTLVAQWTPCTHDPSTTDGQAFTYTADGNTLTRSCNCGGQTITATLNAQDAVYNEQGHPATVSFAKEEVIASTTTEFDVTPTYAGEKLGSYKVPTNAGTYTATLVPKGKTEPVATVTYTIAKAPQPAPPKPEYTIGTDEKTLTIQPVKASDAKYESVAEYRVVRKTETGWTDPAFNSNESALTFTAESPLTNYYVEVRYSESDNYLASPISQADQVFYYSGNVVIKVVREDGVHAYVESDEDGTVVLNMEKLPDYYLLTGEYTVDIDVVKTGGGMPETGKPSVEKTDISHRKLSEFEENTTITITVGGARKIPTVTATVQEDQIFGTVSGDSATISKDSAFTTHFDVNSYDSVAYKDLSLSFGTVSVPAGTSIILVDKTSGSNQYWYTKLETEASSVALTGFTKMGGSANFDLDYSEDDTENFVQDYDLQFVVDFSQTESGCAGNGLSVSLTAAKTGTVTNAPDWPSDSATVTLTATTFGLTADTTNEPGLTRTLTATYSPTANSGTSKWDNRHSALVLTPSGNAELPPDAKLSVEIGGSTTVYDMSGGKFVIPLADLATKEAAITLQSDMFPEGETTYTFTAKWMVSNSLAEGSPLNGDEVGTVGDLSFVKAAGKVPSLKIANASGKNHHLVSKGDQVTPVVSWKDLQDCDVMAVLQKRNNGVYDTVGAGWSDSVFQTQADASKQLDLGTSQFAPGSYRIRVTATQNNLTLLETYYYFIIKTE